MTTPEITQLLSPSILIVDDNPHNLQVLGKLLKENNYEIEFAISGEAALVWLANRKFDLILLDINMPEMNGFEVCMKIRSDHSMYNVPVIFLSAEADRESILRGFELGAQDYITKPFDSRELLSRVKTHLSLKETLESLEQLNKTLEIKVVERTEQLKAANEKLEFLNLKLLNLDKAKSEFLHIISHEIRTPLNGIVGPLELLKEFSGTREILELVEILNTSVKRLEKFSLNALLITRLKTDHTGIRKEKILLPQLLEEVVGEMQENQKARNIKVNIKIESPEALITGEKELVKKSMGNVLENALIYSPEGSNIEINVLNLEEKVLCEIKDKGMGFPEGSSDKMFEPFSEGETKRDGSPGLGLPISRMIMDAHNGEMVIGNNPGGGAFVKLIFRK